MRQKFFISFLLSVTLLKVNSQSTKPIYLGISPTHFFRNTFLLHSEFGIAKDKTLAIFPGVILKEGVNEDLQGFQIEVQPRFYLIHPSFESMDTKYGGARLQPYIAPYYGFMDLKRNYKGYGYDPKTQLTLEKEFERNATAHSGGVLIGCRGNLTKNLYIELNAGGGFRFANIDDTITKEDPNIFPYYYDSNIFDFDYTGIAPKIGLLVGIRFH
jgi:hypothetical protein